MKTFWPCITLLLLCALVSGGQAAEIETPAELAEFEMDAALPMSEFTLGGTTLCTCVCDTQPLRLEEVQTNGSCEDLNGQPCADPWPGTGTYRNCMTN